MKRILVVASVAALSTVGFAGAASAAPATPAGAACCGQVHKTVNSGGVEGFDNVGQLVRALEGGANKNALATMICAQP